MCYCAAPRITWRMRRNECADWLLRCADLVIPAKAGTQSNQHLCLQLWVPALLRMRRVMVAWIISKQPAHNHVCR